MRLDMKVFPNTSFNQNKEKIVDVKKNLFFNSSPPSSPYHSYAIDGKTLRSLLKKKKKVNKTENERSTKKQKKEERKRKKLIDYEKEFCKEPR